VRISDDRYSRDRLRLDIAMHFIRYEARTHTTRQWTGLTDDRIRKLYRAYLQDGGRRVPRHRGKSPRQSAFFMRTARLRQEAAALASICCLLGLLDGEQGTSPPAGLARTAGVARAAALCQAYETYRSLVSMPAISFEHAVLLVETLARGQELRCGGCPDCGVLLVTDPYALHPARCVRCSEGVAPDGPAPARRRSRTARLARSGPP
jgi:hypothetical protein